MSNIIVKEIIPNRSNLKKFVEFPIKLYKGNPYFIPPLVFDDINTFTPKKNPAFLNCEAAFFLAYKDNKIVGRIAAIVNHEINITSTESEVRFGFVDFIDDKEVVKALFDAVENWGRERQLKKIVGPLGFTDLDHEGMLIDGFEELGTMATIYNYPYYPKRLEELGYTKEVDWNEYLITIPTEIPDKHRRIAEIVKKKFNLRILKFQSRKEIKEKYGHALFELINEAYADLYGYSRLSKRQIDYYVNMYIPMLNLDLVTLIVDSEDKLVGVGISMQSMSKALQKSKGKLFPFGWIHLLKCLRAKPHTNDRVDLMLVAVKPEYQGKGVNALLFTDLIPTYNKWGFKVAESNPELAENDKVQNQWDSFEHRLHRRRRAYSKKL